jgi:plasmid replication initiation protein
LIVRRNSTSRSLANAAEKTFAEPALLLDENRLLSEQNNDSNCRKSTKSSVVGKEKCVSYGDVVEARARRNENPVTVVAEAKRIRKNELEVADEEMEVTNRTGEVLHSFATLEQKHI